MVKPFTRLRGSLTFGVGCWQARRQERQKETKQMVKFYSAARPPLTFPPICLSRSSPHSCLSRSPCPHRQP